MKSIKKIFTAIAIYLFFSFVIVIASDILQIISEKLFGLREIQISYLFIAIITILSSEKISEIIKKKTSK